MTCQRCVEAPGGEWACMCVCVLACWARLAASYHTTSAVQASGSGGTTTHRKLNRVERIPILNRVTTPNRITTRIAHPATSLPRPDSQGARTHARCEAGTAHGASGALRTERQSASHVWAPLKCP